LLSSLKFLLNINPSVSEIIALSFILIFTFSYPLPMIHQING